MKNLANLTALLLIICKIFASCNNTDSAASQTNDTTVIKTDSGNVADAEISNSEVNSETNIPGLLIYFKNADWYVNSGKDEIFKGISLALMQGVILSYIREKHIDSKRDYGNYRDAVEIDLIYSTFTFFRRMESKHNLYDAEYYAINNSTRWSSDEEPTKQELAKIKNEQKKRIREINPDWKNIKTYDIYAVNGTYQILKLSSDSIEISIKGAISEADALTLHAYHSTTGFGLMGNTNFEDQSIIDLSFAFIEIGSIHRFDEFDLQIINNQSLKYLRNQFFARKGYIFKTDAMKEYFASKSWYTPAYDDVSGFLSKEEKYNTDLIKQYEEQVK